MRVLVTGAFGNIGTSAVEELVQAGYEVRCFDLPTKANRKAAHRFARRYGERVEVAWGDLRSREDVAGAVAGQDVVVHLAFIIPKLSATGIESEEQPEQARAINVGGTRNLIRAMEAAQPRPRLIFTSSLHVYGRTQHQPPPRTVHDVVCPTEHYSYHKVQCEEMVRASGLEWTIFRLAATLPLAIRLDPGMFDVPLDNRMEFVHTRDVGLAIANAVSSEEVWGKLLLIGGGPTCQHTYREIVEAVLKAMGVGTLPEAAFSRTPFCTDWLDTSESQALLHYQLRDLNDYVADMLRIVGLRRYLARIFRPLVRAHLLRKSPYYRRQRTAAARGRLAPRTV
jgi:UDP-glucose 4-epimerase